MSNDEYCLSEGVCIAPSKLERMESTKKMPMDEFLSNCLAQGGNWTAMLMSGIRHLSETNDAFKKVFDDMPDKTYNFAEVVDLIKPLVEIDLTKR